MTKSIVRLAVLVGLIAVPAWATAQSIIYVNASASGVNNGSSWSDAFVELEPAIDAAVAGDQIWVATGTYNPATSFELKNAVAVHGGFGGSEASLVDRDPAEQPTILSGNGSHVIVATGVDSTTILEGLVVMGGNAHGDGSDGDGGGMLIEDGSPVVMNSRFLGNSAKRGGAIYSRDGSPVFMNVVFSGNTADEGGAIYNERSNAQLTNVTASNNTATTGAGVYNVDSSPVIENSILWGNTEIGGTDNLMCTKEGYPCRLSEVDPDILSRSDDLASEAATRIRGGESLADALAWIQSQNGVVEASSDGKTIRFRLDGGRPTWIFSEAAFKFGKHDGSGQQHHREVLERLKLQKSQGPDDVVGDDPKVKRGLVLAPFLFEFGDADSAPDVANLLSGARGYEGNVTYLANESQDQDSNVGIAEFQSWGGYEVVFVSTHGSQHCVGEECFSSIFTSAIGNVQEIPSNDPPGLEIATRVIDGRRDITLSNDFFSWQYPQGVNDAIVFLDACQSFKSTELAEALAGSSGTFFGWTETVDANFSSPAASAFFGRLIEKGIPTSVGLEHLESQSMVVDPYMGATLTTSVMGDALRIREVIWGTNPLTHQDVPTEGLYPVLGQPGDGEPDWLPFRVRVDGVKGDPVGFVVNVSANGFSADPKPLEEGTQIDDEGNVWMVEGQFALPFDVAQGQELDFVFQVDLPEGGESRQEEALRVGNPEINFESVIETKNLIGDDIVIHSEVHGKFLLAFGRGLQKLQWLGDLEYVDFRVEHPVPSCTITTTKRDGLLQIQNVIFPEHRPPLGLPEEMLMYIPSSISETITITCDGGTVTIPSIHFFAGFYSFHGGQFGHENELDETVGALIIKDWSAGSGSVLAEKIYDRSGQEGQAEFTEKTTIRLQWPE